MKYRVIREAKMKTLTIGKVANRAGIGVETVRFYERQVLIADPPRSDSGYRPYTEDTQAPLMINSKSKDTVFSMTEYR